jgi:hypothetical protein
MPAFQGAVRFDELFRDLAVASRALSAYPGGHPAVAGGLARAHAALSNLLAETGPVEIGAARDALLWSDRRFTSPPAAQLAKLLRRRRAAGLLLDPGVSVEELETFLRALALDPRGAREAGSLAAELAAAGLVRLRVSDLDFSSLALVEAEEAEPAGPEAGAFPSRVLRRLLADGRVQWDRVAGERVARWLTSGRSVADLLGLLLDSGAEGSAGADSLGPAAFAAALSAVAADFREAPDAERAAAVAAVHTRLRGRDRAQLVQELAAVMARQAAALESLTVLSAALPSQVAAELRQAIGKLAAPEPVGDAPPPAVAPPRMHPVQLATLRRAFATDDVDTLRDSQRTAEELAALLELPEDRADRVLSPAAVELGREIGSPSLDRDGTAALLELAERAEVSPEAVPQILRRFEAGYLRQVSGGRIRKAIGLLERVQRTAGGDGPMAAAFRGAAERMTSRESIEAVAGTLPDLPEETFELVPLLVERMGPTAVPHLLDVLARTENRRMRFRLLDLLGKVGHAVARDATALLADGRWYVVRNMLLLLRRVGDERSIPAVRRCVEHPDLRVRLEAIHTLFAFDREVPRGLLRRALHDPDLRQAEAAMELAGKYGIAEAVEPIVDYLRAWDPFGKRRAVRLKGIRALAAIGNPAALEGLGRFRARFQLLPPAIEERREIYRTLPAYPEESYQEWIASGLRSRDAEIRRLSAGMGTGLEAAR